MTIRDVTQRDIEQIVEIYNHYVQTTVITFEEELVDVSEMTSRVKKSPRITPGSLLRTTVISLATPTGVRIAHARPIDSLLKLPSILNRA
jgi:hypothetical protein